MPTQKAPCSQLFGSRGIIFLGEVCDNVRGVHVRELPVGDARGEGEHFLACGGFGSEGGGGNSQDKRQCKDMLHSIIPRQKAMQDRWRCQYYRASRRGRGPRALGEGEIDEDSKTWWFAALCAASVAGAAAPVPELVTRNGRTALLVDGAPYLVLGAQVNNSSAWPAMLPKVWPAVNRSARTPSACPLRGSRSSRRADSTSRFSIHCSHRRARRMFDWSCCGSRPGRTTVRITRPNG